MENLESNLQSNESIYINDEIKIYLSETAKWAKFLSILGFIGLGLLVLIPLIISITFNEPTFSLIAIIYIIIAIVYIIPINYLYIFSTNIKRGINSNNQELITSGLKNLKSHYKFIGILTIVIVSIYILIFLIPVLLFAIR